MLKNPTMSDVEMATMSLVFVGQKDIMTGSLSESLNHKGRRITESSE